MPGVERERATVGVVCALQICGRLDDRKVRIQLHALYGRFWPMLLKKELNFALKLRTNSHEKCLTFIGE